jgi:hypothetical protein
MVCPLWGLQLVSADCLQETNVTEQTSSEIPNFSRVSNGDRTHELPLFIHQKVRNINFRRWKLDHIHESLFEGFYLADMCTCFHKCNSTRSRLETHFNNDKLTYVVAGALQPLSPHRFWLRWEQPNAEAEGSTSSDKTLCEMSCTVNAGCWHLEASYCQRKLVSK